jgi:hypothetical protein
MNNRKRRWQMQVSQSDETHVVVDLTHNEMILFNNALNEVCHGLGFSDFSTRLGAERGELEALRCQVEKSLEGMMWRIDEG